jgi:hypothetical protein
MKRILLITYFASIESSVMSEWVLDKVDTLNRMGFVVDIITSSRNPLRKEPFGKFIRVGSVNPSSFFKENGLSKRVFLDFILLPFVITVGLFYEIIERLILGRIGDGKWGWMLSSTVIASILSLTSKYELILSTGGPASSHVSAVIAGFVSNKRVIIELQDPLYGKDIGHNTTSSVFLLKIEKFLVRFASKVVYVTKSAAEESQLRYPNNKNIVGIYTSSRKLVNKNETKIIRPTINDKKIMLLHLGTIYSTRNYASLLEVLENEDFGVGFEIVNIGHVSEENIPNGLKKTSFKIESIIERIKGLENALSFDAILLIQHTDLRSELTIPYKTWDYLNLEMPIIGLLNNEELAALLIKHGHYVANVNDLLSIKIAIKKYLADLKSNSFDIQINQYDIFDQVRELIS